MNPAFAYDKARSLMMVKPGSRLRLADHDPGWSGDADLPKKERKEIAGRLLEESRAELADAQELLYAADSWSVLVVFQAMDAAGKDGAIKHVMSGVNPQGVDVRSFKHPTAKELEHTFLWRSMLALPERGRIGIFNRSHYEEVLVVRVHPHLVDAQRIPGARVDQAFWQERYEDIVAFERHLARNGTAIVKFFLNVSPEEQRKRLLDRLDDPDKHWKFSPSDVREREHWDSYMQAYEEAITATSTEHAPWYVVPADHKWVSRAVVSAVLAGTIRDLGLAYPQIDAERRSGLEEARRRLEAEADEPRRKNKKKKK